MCKVGHSTDLLCEAHLGTWCSYEGYCNKNGQCVTVNSQDVLNELEDLVNSISAKGAWKWITSNWPYAAAAAGVVGIIVVGLVV